MYLFALLVVLIVNTLYWPQLVLFQQKASIRLRNCLLGYLAVFVLFASWTLLVLPILGVWYILFLSQFLLYEQMDDAYQIDTRCSESQQ